VVIPNRYSKKRQSLLSLSHDSGAKPTAMEERCHGDEGMALQGQRDGTQEGVNFRGTTSLAADAAATRVMMTPEKSCGL
jgi:hypothetical protein